MVRVYNDSEKNISIKPLPRFFFQTNFHWFLILFTNFANRRIRCGDYVHVVKFMKTQRSCNQFIRMFCLESWPWVINCNVIGCFALHALLGQELKYWRLVTRGYCSSSNNNNNIHPSANQAAAEVRPFNMLCRCHSHQHRNRKWDKRLQFNHRWWR